MAQVSNSRPRWKIRLETELEHRSEFADLSPDEWRAVLRRKRITSSNYDTVMSLDWPHFCSSATEACGGASGWCYTFQGNQSLTVHNRHVAMVDVLARNFPSLFGEIVCNEVDKAVRTGRLPYPNLRYSGSGEVVLAYLPALKAIMDGGVHLWGFSRNLSLANALRDAGASVIVSCDHTSDKDFIQRARSDGFDLAYSSESVADLPPDGTLVTFPVHKIGRVHEVTDSPTVCPKVLEDFLYDERHPATCQERCRLCHKLGEDLSNT